MEEIPIVGVDLAKNVFQIPAANSEGRAIVRKRLLNRGRRQKRITVKISNRCEASVRRTCWWTLSPGASGPKPMAKGIKFLG